MAPENPALYQTLQFLKIMPRINTDEIIKEFGDWRNFSIFYYRYYSMP